MQPVMQEDRERAGGEDERREKRQIEIEMEIERNRKKERKKEGKKERSACSSSYLLHHFRLRPHAHAWANIARLQIPNNQGHEVGRHTHLQRNKRERVKEKK